MNKLKIVLIIFTTIITCGCSEGQPEFNNDTSSTTDDLTNTDFNILFIGNSLTYTNDLPELVKNRAKQKGIIIGTKMIALGNYAIIDHWEDGEVQKQISSKKFHFVIIQQGPSSQSEGREILIEYGEKLQGLCEENDAQLGYFMVWPSLTYYNTFEGVIQNYSDAARINDAILCPVGKVWKEHFDSTDNFDYYGVDGFHPSLKGSQVAADVIVESLFP